MKELTEIQSISFVGSGNVATHLAQAFQLAHLQIQEVYSPNEQHALAFSKMFKCTKVKSPNLISSDADLILLCVPDTQVALVAKQISRGRAIIAHTSGIVPLSGIQGNGCCTGVFYPLQTFSLGRMVDFLEIPICIEGNETHTNDMLTRLAYKLSNKVVSVTSPEREMLHLTAVMVNNFSNMLYGMAHEILEENHLDFKLLLPLIRETASKVVEMSPKEAQTGPARRKDLTTIQRHHDLLTQFPHYQQLYQLITDQIIKKHHE